MNLAQLRESTDAELNELSALKFGWIKCSIEGNGLPEGWKDPNGVFMRTLCFKPTTDMNDVTELQNALNDDELHSYTLRLMKMVSAFGHITYQDVTNILKSSARERTIAAILSKEESK